MQIGVADYGMNVWDGGSYDFLERCTDLKKIGYEGVERLTVFSADEAIAKSSRIRKLGMDFSTVRGPSVELSVQWTAGLGRGYVWLHGVEQRDFDAFCRQANRFADICHSWGVRVALHNHMGTLVETQEQLELFLARCPDCQLVFDTAHLAAMGGDAQEIARKYAHRLQVIHVKDWNLVDPQATRWEETGYFCGLGKGNIGLDNLEVLKAAAASGYDGWVYVEHDTHLQEPLLDLKESREYLAKGGF
ncbi:hypothetical protein B1748_17360 [Paenibacillus sp. MY03]|uniref:sugar phosphate isomerase/epimerase family protein n=1 Tax=Paenibacillus sp. MY03 TaxID=302980 RepID=UPI000B3CC6ED|nr:sugar phosphate isomerase/epimerase [Paenibacillus sp. MY03]OUS75263.1 hypothetical protein B1748_17360 [Paenibacillus sp. MY03]